MTHEIPLSQAVKQTNQLNALLLVIEISGSKLTAVDLSVLITLALDLAGGPGCWLNEEMAQREAIQ